MVKFGPREAAYTAVMTALTAAGTMVIRIPIFRSYYHIGDSLIIFAALTFGPVVGGIAGGVGPAIADLIGFPMWAPFTLVFHGVEGILAGWLGWGRSWYRQLGAAVIGVIPMIVGYVLVVTAMFGPGFGVVELIGDTGQGLVGVFIGWPLAQLVQRAYPAIVKK